MMATLGSTTSFYHPSLSSIPQALPCERVWLVRVRGLPISQTSDRQDKTKGEWKRKWPHPLHGPPQAVAQTFGSFGEAPQPRQPQAKTASKIQTSAESNVRREIAWPPAQGRTRRKGR